MNANHNLTGHTESDPDQDRLLQQQLNQSWQARYLEGSIGWDRGGSSPALQRWLAMETIQAGHKVLVPACGNGHEVIDLARMGCQVSAVDLAPAALSKLRERLDSAGLAAELVQADLLQWQADQRFDVIYEQTALCALHPSSWQSYAGRLASWIKPGGLLLAAFMQTGRDGGPPFDCPLAAMRALFPASEWLWLDDGLQMAHPSGLHEQCHTLRRTSTT